MNKYDIELLNLLEGHLCAGDCLNSHEILVSIQDKKIESIKGKNGLFLRQNPDQHNLNENDLSNKSYILRLITSNYPNILLSEYSSLNIESKRLKDALQRTSLENSSKIINNNKEVILRIKLNFLDFEQIYKNSTSSIIFDVFEKIDRDKDLILNKLSIYKGLKSFKVLIPKISELVQLPELIENLINACMIDDALDLLEYGKSAIKLLETSLYSTRDVLFVSSGIGIANVVLERIERNIEIKAMTFYTVLKRKLNSNRLSLIEAIEVIWQLKRLIYLNRNNNILLTNDVLFKQLQENENELYTEYILGKVFLDARSEFINLQYINKSQGLIGVNSSASLDSALNLFDSPMLLTISTFNSIFSSSINSTLPKYWLSSYIHWFVRLCKSSLTLVHYETFRDKFSKESNKKLKLHTKTIYVALFNLKKIPVTAYSCYRLYLHVMDSFSKPIQLLILPLFDNYIVEYYRKLLEYSLEIFTNELNDYINNIKYTKFDGKYIRPFEVLFNEYVHAINEIRLCPLFSISTFIIDISADFLDLIFRVVEDATKQINNRFANTVQHELSQANIDDDINSIFSEIIRICYAKFYDEVVALLSLTFCIDKRVVLSRLD